MFEQISVTESLGFIMESFLIMFIIGDVVLSFLTPKSYKKSQNDTILDFFILRIAVGISFIILFSEVIGMLTEHLNESLIAITIVMLILFGVNLFFKLNKLNIKNISRKIVNRDVIFLNKIFYEALSILLLFLVFLFSSNLIVGFYGSTGGDQDYHTTIIYLIQKQNKLPLYGKPYYSFVVDYPLGYHLFAYYLSLLFQIPLYKIVLMTAVFMPIFTFLASYYLAKSLFNSTILGIISGFISLCIQKPMAEFGWGGYPFGISLFFVLISLALSPKMNKKATLKDLLIYGMLLYAIVASHVLEIFVVILWYLIYLIYLLLYLLFNTLKGKHKIVIEIREQEFRFIKNTVISFSIMLIFGIGILYQEYIRFITPNGGYPSEVTFYMPFEITLSGIVPLFNFDIWTIAIFNQNIGFTYAELTSYIFMAPLLMLLQGKREETIYGLLLLTLYIFIIFLDKFVIANYTLLCNYLPFFIVEYLIMIAKKPIDILPIFLSNLLSIILTTPPYLLYREVKKMRIIKNENMSFTIRINIWFLIALIISSVFMQAYFSFINIFIEKKIYGFYIMRENLLKCNILAQDDLELIYWISKNLPKDATIIVYFQDSGHYVLPLADRKIIYPNNMLMYSYYYLKLIDLLTNDPSNPEILFLMKKFNSDYVYIGSTNGKYWVGPLDFYYPKPLKPLNSSKLSTSPFFRLVACFGNACLFQIKKTSESTITVIDKYKIFENEYTFLKKV